MLSHYPLQENDEYSYEFLTDKGIRYKIYFLDYSYMFSEYQSFLSPVYTFNIDVMKGDPDSATGDDRIGLTVLKVFNDFFAKIENVAIYVCDSSDERQLARKRKFDVWFWSYNDGSIVKEDGMAIIEGTIIYNALLVHWQNKQLPDIIFAFKDLNARAGEK